MKITTFKNIVLSTILVMISNGGGYDLVKLVYYRNWPTLFLNVLRFIKFKVIKKK